MTKDKIQGMLAEGYDLNQIAAIHMINKQALQDILDAGTKKSTGTSGKTSGTSGISNYGVASSSGTSGSFGSSGTSGMSWLNEEGL